MTANYPIKAASRQAAVDEKPNLALAKSMTDDEDEYRKCELMASNAECFLDNYEKMMRHQDDEMMMTLCHLEPLLVLLEKQCGRSDSKFNPNAAPFTKEFTYRELEQAVHTLQNDPSHCYVGTDLQWSMVLQLLTENSNECEENDLAADRYISWVEVAMCYRICIIGMQALQQIPAPKPARTRVRQRTMQILSMFKASSTVSFHSQKDHEQTRSASTGWFGNVEVLFPGFTILLLLAITIASFVNGFPIANFVSSSTHSLEVRGHPGTTLAPVINAGRSPSNTMSDLAIDSTAPISVDNDFQHLLIPGPKVPPVADVVTPEKLDLRIPTLPPTAVKTASSTILKSGHVVSTVPTAHLPTKQDLKRPQRAPSLKIQKRQLPPSPGSPMVVATTSHNPNIKLPGRAVLGITGGFAVGAVLGPLVANLLRSLSPLATIGATILVSTVVSNRVREIFDFLVDSFSELEAKWK